MSSHYLSIITPTSLRSLCITHLTGTTSISTPDHYSLKVISKNHHLFDTEPLTQTASIRINSPTPQFIHGIITGISIGPIQQNHWRQYAITLSSPLHLLAHHYGSQTFHHQSILEIIAYLFEQHHLTNYSFQYLTKQYATITYCVQYEESSADFLHRLLAETGIAYFIQQSATGAMLFFCDTLSCYREGKAHVSWPRANRQEASKRDYLHKTTQITCHQAHYHAGDILPKRHQKGEQYIICRSVFSIEHDGRHINNILNIQPLSHSLTSKASPKKPMHGVLLACVLGGTDSIIHCNKQRQVKVSFHWPALYPSSDCYTKWLSYAQIQANTSQQGLAFLPRVGDTVAVIFERGQANQPYIIGSLYTDCAPPPFDPSHHPSRMGLRADKHTFFLDDEKPAQTTIKSQASIRYTLKKHYQLSVSKCYELTAGKNYQCTIDQGTYSIFAQDTLVLKTPDARIEINKEGISVLASSIALNTS